MSFLFDILFYYNGVIQTSRQYSVRRAWSGRSEKRLNTKTSRSQNGNILPKVWHYVFVMMIAWSQIKRSMAIIDPDYNDLEIPKGLRNLICIIIRCIFIIYNWFKTS